MSAEIEELKRVAVEAKIATARAGGEVVGVGIRILRRAGLSDAEILDVCMSVVKESANSANEIVAVDSDWPADGVGGCQGRNGTGQKCVIQQKHTGTPHVFCPRWPHEGYCSSGCFNRPRARTEVEMGWARLWSRIADVVDRAEKAFKEVAPREDLYK